MSSCDSAVRSCIRACLRGRRDAEQGFHMLDDQTEAPAPVDDQQEGVRDAEPTEPLVSSRPASAAQVPPPPAAAYLAVMRHSVRFYVGSGGSRPGGRHAIYISHAAPKRRSASIATMTRSGPSRRRGLTTRPSRTGSSRRRSARRCDGSASIASSPRLSGGASRRRAWSPRRSV